MKKVLLVCSLVFVYGYSIAQSLTATNYSSNVVHPNPFQVAQYVATINNISSSTKAVMVERTVNNLAPGHTSYFCWDVCYSESTYISGNPLAIPAGGQNNSFYFDLDPHGVTGIDTCCYKFFDMNNVSDFVEICFYVDVTTGIATTNASQRNPLSVASPNPANTLSGIKYYTDVTKNPQLVIYNLLGTKVFEARLMQNQGAYIVNVGSFDQGIYLYSLLESGKAVATQKLIVAHK